MDSPLVSIIIPVYNAEKYLVEAIMSAINQTWSNKEIIIVDDGSTDKSLTIAKGFENESIKVYSLPVNQGQSAASNFGYKKSSGSFIKYLDADDIIDLDFVSIMMNQVDSDTNLYFSHCINFHDDFNSCKQQAYKVESWNKMLPVDFILSPASCMRQGGRWLIPKKIIEKGGLWNEQLSLINDFEYFTRLCLNCDNVKYIDRAVSYYRQLQTSVSSDKTLKAFQSAYLSIDLAGEQLLAAENTDRIKLYIANSLQGLLYSIYPLYSTLAKKIKKRIIDFGGSNRPLDAGGKTLLFSKLFGWKIALYIRYYSRRFIIK